MSNKDALIKDLETIIKLLADVWPNDRENVAIAGAKFEEVTNNVDNNFGQFQKLIDLSWQGIKHLYEKDEYFMMVKTATMQAVNTIREYVIEDGDIKVEDFEKAYEELEKSLEGGSESADSVIELDDEKAREIAENGEGKKSESRQEKTEVFTLDDLAAFLVMLNEDDVQAEDARQLDAIVSYLFAHEAADVTAPLKEAMTEVEANNGAKGWLKILSDKTEEALDISAQNDWTDSMEAETTVKTVEASPQKEEVLQPSEEHADKPKAASEVFYIPEDIEADLVGEFITECSELLEMAESALLDLEEKPNDDELINTIFRAFHTIKGTSAFMALDPISEFTHFVETLLSMVREGDLPFDRACADINFESIDILNEMLDVVEVSGGGDPLHKPEAFDGMMAVLHAISEEGEKPAEALKAIKGQEHALPETPIASNEEITDEAVSSSANSKPAADKTSSKSETESSVRVSVERLDRLIDMVGELVIAHSVVAQDEAIPKDTELQKKVNHASKILRELQDSSLTLRMVPLKATFHKMNRLVRDLSRKAGKQVKFSTFGEDTEIDRNMVDIINEPLIHMLRNSLDHGVEEPEQRVANGKEATSNISLSASQEGGKVVIEIKDDGRGIDKDVIFKKAVEKGLIDPERNLTDTEIYNLIFLPGFSSAEKVTDLSGRGVGMDVVRRSIEQLQGKVDVDSELGSGTTITIELPFTLAITDGMLVQIGTERFIVPTINIDMTFRAEEKDLFTMLGDSEQVNFRGQSVPVIRLHKLFDVKGAVEDIRKGTLLVIKNSNRRYALLVDEVIGQQHLVGKSIHMPIKSKHVSGGAILGDGRVGLILDTGALVDPAA